MPTARMGRNPTSHPHLLSCRLGPLVVARVICIEQLMSFPFHRAERGLCVVGSTSHSQQVGCPALERQSLPPKMRSWAFFIPQNYMLLCESCPLFITIFHSGPSLIFWLMMATRLCFLSFLQHLLQIKWLKEEPYEAFRLKEKFSSFCRIPSIPL